jgi:hypothetical protein
VDGITAGLLHGQIGPLAMQTGGGESITVPADFIVASDACATKIPFEWETYGASTGVVNLWAQAPSLSSSSNTVLYLCWGASGVTTFQGNVSGTWDPNFLAVYHLPNGSTLSGTDSTSNANTLMLLSSPTAVTTGKIGGAAGFGTTDQYAGPYAVSGSNISIAGAATVSGW